MKRIAPLGALAAALAVWWAVSTQTSPLLLPSPADVAEAAWTDRARLAEATWNTALASLAGLGIASVFGVGGAVAFLRVRWLEAGFYPLALLLQTVPIIAIAPLLVVWLGYGTPVAVTAAAIVCFFPILTAGNLGLRSADPAEVELMRLYGASWFQELRLLRWWAGLPYLLTGYRTAVGLAVIGAIVGEFVGSNGQPASLGNLVLRSAGAANTGLTFAAIGASTLVALVLFGAVRLAEARLIGRWHSGSRS
ncbi:MAG: ABC transporter permease [Proteobacteria bacterium]|nr:ABC transporter permease [Pseudomonadota bacterium]MCP4919176.1 ABC transporter permease [Pseudomonadota bacterium]